MQWPLKFELIHETPGTYTEHPVTGNLVYTPGPRITIKVFAWEIVRSVEESNPSSPSAAILFEDLRIYAPPNTFQRESKVITPDERKWAMNGTGDDNRHNPWFDPGMVTYHAKLDTPGKE